MLEYFHVVKGYVCVSEGQFFSIWQAGINFMYVK